MDAERWKQVDDLLQAALDHPPAARAEFLLRSCGGDETLEREVSSLLASHDAAGKFLESSARDAAARAAGLELYDESDEALASRAALVRCLLPDSHTGQSTSRGT